MSLPIHLEGTTLEGGGQLLRLATCLSALTLTPIHVTNIRGKRSGDGGLKAQHLTSVQWLGQMSNASLSGVGLKSREVTFMPGARGLLNPSSMRDIVIKQSTPGAVNLVLQAILPYVLFSGGEEKVRIHITGGTNVSNSPSVEYVTQVLLPMLALIGIPSIDVEVQSRGWSQGSASIGSVTYIVTPLQRKLPAFRLTYRGEVKSIQATVIAPKDWEALIRDELDVMFEKRESVFFGRRDPDLDVTFEDSRHQKRFYLLLVATTTTGMKLGRDWLYSHGVREGKMNQIVASLVKQVSDDLIAELQHGGCVDEYLRDQLVVFQALADGKSCVYGGTTQGVAVKPSLHARTAHWVAKELIGVEFDEDGNCEGIGFAIDNGEMKDKAAEKELADEVKNLRVSA